MAVQNFETIGIIGGGQLAMFLAQACHKWNCKVAILEKFVNCSAQKYAEQFILGNYEDEQKLIELFTISDCVIFENENLNIEIIANMEKMFPGKLLQTSIVMAIAQNRLHEKLFLKNMSIMTAESFNVNEFADINMAHAIFGYGSDMILKTTKFGYDGKNQIYIKFNNLDAKKAEILSLLANNECIIEKVCQFKYEISFIGTYKNNKMIAYLPITQNIHINGILHKSAIIYENKMLAKAKAIFKKIISKLPGAGILTIEFFVDHQDNLIVNELAPRVHNSGHHSLNNCKYSQFDLMIMNILNIKKPNKIIKNWSMYNVLSQNYSALKNLNYSSAEASFYDYNKLEIKDNRKMAHINTKNNLDNLYVNKK